MQIYTVHQAKTKLSQLIQKALHGEEVIIANRHKPVVKLTVIQPLKRKLGFLGKSVWMSDDFDQPLEDFRDYR